MQHVDPYKTAAELGITADERRRLIGVARTLLADTDPFDMGRWDACIKGHMYPLENYFVKSFSFRKKRISSKALHGLFAASPIPAKSWNERDPVRFLATKKDAVIAINKFLLGADIIA